MVVQWVRIPSFRQLVLADSDSITKAFCKNVQRIMHSGRSEKYLRDTHVLRASLAKTKFFLLFIRPEYGKRIHYQW